MTPLKALGGTSDILPDEIGRWHALESTARRVLDLYGYREIRTPLIEEAAVFTGSLGEAAEIVTKQMYLFQDRGGRQVVLRPEGTASVVRAFIEHGLDKTAGLTKFSYMGPMFRAERPQAGRKRQFHQLGVEVFGSASPYQDVEVILLLVQLLKEWGIEGWKMGLNSIGCKEDRPKIVELIRAKLRPVETQLCEDCRVRLEKNPLRILDCKNLECQKLSDRVDVIEAICPDCTKHFQIVWEMLKNRFKIPGLVRDPHLVRGLDYYTRTAFEVVHGDLGAQNALGGGGRYDDLVEQLGGISVPAIGFAVGLERVLMAQEANRHAVAAGDEGLKVFVATVSAAQIPNGLELVETLRANGIAASANLEDRPLKRQMEQVAKVNPSGTVLILGEDEIKQGVVMVKNLATGEQAKQPLATVVEKLKSA